MSSPTLETIKQGIELLDVASHYCELQKQNGNYKAKVNPLREERTSSLVFYADSQKYHDFGSGESGDVFDFIQKMERCTLGEAKEKALSLIGKVPLHVSTPTKPKPDVVVIDSQALKAEFNRFERIDFNNPIHMKELLQVVPAWLLQTANPADVAFFKSITRYDAHLKTLVVAWYENTGTAFIMRSYKWRRKGSGKWVNRVGTHPNSVAFSRIIDIHKIFVIEGAHDALTAVLLGISFVAIPSTSYSNFEQFKHVVHPRAEITYIVEDAQGFDCMDRLNAVVEGRMLCLTDEDTKMDLSDFVFTKNSIEEVLDGM